MIEVHPQGHHVLLTRRNIRLTLTWAEANKLQADLRQLLTAEGVTMRDTV